MDKFDIIGELRRAAIERGWVFCAGDKFYQNIEMTSNDIGYGQLILVAQFDSRPTITNGRVMGITYNGSILLGCKFDDDGTSASLDETYLEKYDRRLLSLMQSLGNFLGELECAAGLSISQVEMPNAINQFDTNIDFVGGTVVIMQP